MTNLHNIVQYIKQLYIKLFYKLLHSTINTVRWLTLEIKTQGKFNGIYILTKKCKFKIRFLNN
jgi:hypothetical protein